MGVKERRVLFEQLEKQRDCRVISLFQSERITDVAQMEIGKSLTQDHIVVFHRHLREIGEVKHIGLILHTRGGDTSVPWPLVNAVRSFCGRLTLFVPFRAHSAGTLIAMGANETVMTKAAELSPIDPTTANQFNPRDPANQQKVLGISVEDLSAFIELAKERIGLGADDAAAILQSLTGGVSPIALGNVQRTHNQIRLLAKKLLGLHMDTSEKQTANIVDKLTERLHSHLHFINRREARDDIGLNVADATEDEEASLWEIYEDYSNEVAMDEPFKVREFLGQNLNREIAFQQAFIESMGRADVYETKFKINQSSRLPDNVLTQLLQGGNTPAPQIIPGLPIQVDMVVLKDGWVMK